MYIDLLSGYPEKERKELKTLDLSNVFDKRAPRTSERRTAKGCIDIWLEH